MPVSARNQGHQEKIVVPFMVTHAPEAPATRRIPDLLGPQDALRDWPLSVDF
jgi:hypothetical protein